MRQEVDFFVFQPNAVRDERLRAQESEIGKNAKIAPPFHPLDERSFFRTFRGMGMQKEFSARQSGHFADQVLRAREHEARRKGVTQPSSRSAVPSLRQIEA